MAEYLCQATLPLAPSINRTYATGRGKFYCTPEARAFKDECAIALHKAQVAHSLLAAIQENKRNKLQTPLALSLSFYLPSLWKSDIDGRVKLTMDALFQYLKLNDNLVTSLTVGKLLDKKHPRCEARLTLDAIHL